MKGHSRNPSVSIKKKISLVKNIYNPFLHNIRGVWFFYNILYLLFILFVDFFNIIYLDFSLGIENRI